MSEDRIPYNQAGEALKTDVQALEKAVDVLRARGFQTTAEDLVAVIEAIDQTWLDPREVLPGTLAVVPKDGGKGIEGKLVEFKLVAGDSLEFAWEVDGRRYVGRGESHRDAVLDFLRQLRESTGRHWRIKLEDGTRIEV